MGLAPATALLQSYFPFVEDLKSYLARIIQASDHVGGVLNMFGARETDSSLYATLVDTTFVASTAQVETLNNLSFKMFPAVLDMREVLDKAQERVFRSRNAQNIITAGYRRASRDGDRGRQDMSRVGIANHFVNTIVTALQSPEWNLLLQRIGVDAMLHLLTETSIFVSLPNGCLCQVTGEPLINMAPHLRAEVKEQPTRPPAEKRPFPFPDQHGQHPAKRHRPRSSATRSKRLSQDKMTKKTSANISFAHSKIFYSRPERLPETGRIVVGLSRNHILNKIHPSYQRSSSTKPGDYVDPDPKEQQQHARHLSKYVFPRQYGLRNAFSETSSKRPMAHFTDYSDREAEIKTEGPCRTPRRLRDVLRLLDKMLWRHGKCGYKALREKACPSKVCSTDGKQLDSSVILECVSEQSIILTQMQATDDTSYDSCGDRILPFGSTQAERHAKAKPRFADFACSYVEVYRYVILVTNAVIPKAFWGGKKNMKIIFNHVKAFIHCRRYEDLTLHHTLQGFSTSACDWLMPPGVTARHQARVSVSDALKRREILEEFIYWYFDSFVTSLLKTSFYVTETSAFRNRVLYFLQDDWEAMCAPLIERLTGGTFMKISDTEAAEVLRQRKLGFSFVRLLPKETGVRPIVNLRRRTTGKRHRFHSEQSINQILQAAFHILSYEKQNSHDRLGASVSSRDDIYTRLKDFKSRLPRLSDGKLPKLYFVKMDVQACFDTIDQTKLLEILRELLSEDRYLIQRYGQVQSSTGRVKRTFVKKAMPEDDHPHFLTYAAKLAGLLRQTIFVDQVVYSYSQRQDILSLLEEHITENIVKIGAHYYRQTVGIPQGSVLSSILCSFFYGDLEQRFTDFSCDPKSVMFRFIDDYLFITSSKTKAIQFLEMMNKGHPEYGCFISKDKTLTNFDFGIEITAVTEPMQQSFPWCGYMINMKDLSVSVDYSRYHGISMRDTLTIDRCRNPGVKFTQKMLWLVRAKCHPIHLDPTLNPTYVIYLNLYQNFVVCAMKMHGYLSGLQSSKNSDFIYNAIQKMIYSCNTSLRHGQNRSKVNSGQSNSSIRKPVVFWLGAHAFYHVLKNKPSRYPRVLRSLKFELSRPRSKRFKKQFSRLTREGLASLREIPF